MGNRVERAAANLKWLVGEAGRCNEADVNFEYNHV
jgi:hypothetical protein